MCTLPDYALEDNRARDPAGAHDAVGRCGRCASGHGMRGFVVGAAVRGASGRWRDSWTWRVREAQQRRAPEQRAGVRRVASVRRAAVELD